MQVSSKPLLLPRLVHHLCKGGSADPTGPNTADTLRAKDAQACDSAASVGAAIFLLVLSTPLHVPGELLFVFWSTFLNLMHYFSTALLLTKQSMLTFGALF